MSSTVSAADANRQFSQLLGRAAGGEVVVITRRGNPVAQLAPYTDPVNKGTADMAWTRLLATLQDGLPLGGQTFDRESLYER